MARGRVISAVLTLKDRDFSTNAKKATSALTDTQRQAKHAQNTVSNFGKSATSSFRSIATGAASIAGAIGIVTALSGAINMVRNSLGSAMGRIDTMEQFDRVMTTMLGSTEAANKALEDTSAIVTGTAYGLNTAAGAVQQFTTSGTSIDKTTGYVSALSDAVSFYGDGTDETFSRVTSAMAEMATSGTASLGSIRTLTEANIPVFQIYADATGKNANEVQKSLERGEISAEQFLDTLTGALMDGTDQFASIQGAAREAGASWSGSFANMRAAVTRGVMGIIERIDEMLTHNGLPDMRQMVANVGTAFEGVLNKASDTIPIVTGYLVGMYDKAKPGIDWLKDTGLPAVQDGISYVTDRAKDMYNFVSDNWSLIAPVVAGITATVLAFRAGVVAVTTATRIWAGVTAAVQVATAILNGTLAISPLGWVALAIGAVVGISLLLYKNWDKVREVAGNLWQRLQDNPLLALAAGPFGVLIAAGVTLYNNFDKIRETFNRFKDAITNFKLPKWVSTVGGAISGAVNRLTGGGKEPEASYAVGTNRVPRDMVAQIHKDEMIVPAVQSRNLRRKGVTIDNIDQVGTQRSTPSNTTNNQTSNSNVFNITINAQDRSISDIVNELVPLLKMRMANT